MNSTLLRQEIMNLVGSGYAPRFQLRAVFTVGAQTYPVQAVLEKRTESDFAARFVSTVSIHVAMITKNFMALFRSRDNLYLTLFQEQVDPVSETPLASGVRKQTTFRAFFADNEIASLNSDVGLQSTPFTDGSDDLRMFTVQLVDPIALSMSAKSAQGTFRLTTAVDALKTFIIMKAEEDQQKGLPKLLALDVVKPDVEGQEKARNQIVIDHRVRMVELPSYLQGREGGIYNHDIGSFIQDQKWFIYPLYNTRRFRETERRLTILQADSLKLPTADLTYRQEGQSITVVCTGGVKTQDLSVAGDISGGLGIHFQKATEFFSSPVVDDGDNRVVYNRENIGADISARKREDGLSFAPVAGNPFTDNLAREQSKIAGRNGMIMLTTWQRSDARLLTPGMPVRVYYDNGSSVMTLEGTLLQVIEQWTTEKPGLMQKLQKSVAGLMFFLEKP